jgi:hypothetical protein
MAFSRRFQFSIRSVLLCNLWLAGCMAAVILPLGLFRSYCIALPVGWLFGLSQGNEWLGVVLGFTAATTFLLVSHYFGRLL